MVYEIRLLDFSEIDSGDSNVFNLSLATAEHSFHRICSVQTERNIMILLYERLQNPIYQLSALCKFT